MTAVQVLHAVDYYVHPYVTDDAGTTAEWEPTTGSVYQPLGWDDNWPNAT